VAPLSNSLLSSSLEEEEGIDGYLSSDEDPLDDRVTKGLSESP
jgi:hypothetical protein